MQNINKLIKLNKVEWENVCDGCGLCCLAKVANEAGEIKFTDVICRFYDQNECKCSKYDQLGERREGCVPFNYDNFSDASAQLPSTCAYRLLESGQELPSWHHLVCGDRSEIHRQGRSVAAWAVSEYLVDESDFPIHIIDFINV